MPPWFWPPTTALFVIVVLPIAAVSVPVPWCAATHRVRRCWDALVGTVKENPAPGTVLLVGLLCWSPARTAEPVPLGAPPSLHENENGVVPGPVPTERPSGPSERSPNPEGLMSVRALMADPPFLPVSPVNDVELVPQIRQSVVPIAVRSWEFGLLAGELNPV